MEELNAQHQDEVERLQEQLRRERQRCQDDRLHYEHEANQIRRISHERAQAEIERIKEEEENKRRVLNKKHAVSFFILIRYLLRTESEMRNKRNLTLLWQFYKLQMC